MTDAPNILLVDDDADFIAIHARILEGAGYRVLRAANPDEALARLEADHPALIVTDLMMDRLDAGFSLARRIKRDERFAGIPIIVVSGVGARLGFDFHPKQPAELAAMGADAYFPKPVNAQVLIQKIKELLERRDES